MQVTHLPERAEIVMLCASDAATACLVRPTKGAEIYVMHRHGCKKISLGWVARPLEWEPSWKFEFILCKDAGLSNEEDKVASELWSTAGRMRRGRREQLSTSRLI